MPLTPGFRPLHVPFHTAQREQIDRLAAERGMKPTTLVRSIVYSYLRDLNANALVTGARTSSGTS